MLVGYTRVSTRDQNLDLQRDALTKVGCEKIFEKKSGKAGTRRPEIEAAFEHLARLDWQRILASFAVLNCPAA